MAAIDSFAIPVPEELIGAARTWAERDAVSVEQFVRRAIEETIAARQDAFYLADRASRGSVADLDRILAKAGTEPPAPGDEIPEGWVSGK
jgi:hypothetical protein